MPLKAVLHIEAARRNGGTVLKRAFCTQPLKLANVTEQERSHTLKLMIRSSSPGILDGDEYAIRIEVAEGCSLQMETQSYQRLFQMKGSASQEMEVFMQTNSSFSYLPHPSVPHKGSVFRAKNTICLSDGCSLTWGEITCCGRKLNGEVFRFSSYHSLTQIFKNGKLAVKENLLMKPDETDPTGIGMMEGFSHQATLVYMNEMADITGLTIAVVNELNRHTSILFGVSALPVNGILIRLLGDKAEQLFHLQKMLAAFIADFQKNEAVKKEAYAI